MSKLRFRISMSLDGFVAGPDQSVDNPLGIGGEGLHDWVVQLAAWRGAHGLPGGEVNESSKVVEEEQAGIGSTIMGRNMFGGHPGPWDPKHPWNGWWGEDPPFHHPVFVLTHHPRESIEMQGGTTFHFVTDGFDEAYAQAKDAAGDGEIGIAGGTAVLAQRVLEAIFGDQAVREMAATAWSAGIRSGGTASTSIIRSMSVSDCLISR